jgi:thienamycin biosynthesis protein ThnN
VQLAPIRPTALVDAAPPVLAEVTDEHVRRIVGLHLDPENGSPYWLERDRRLGTEALRRVHGWADALEVLSFRDAADQAHFEEASRRTAVDDFVPRSVREAARRGEGFLWTAQTGGTTGTFKHGTWGAPYWDQIMAFSDEFLDLHGVPRGGNWLFVGPTGPHTTGRLVIDIAQRRGGMCFSIDLDPRIVKIFGGEGMAAAADRYVKHIWDQVRSVLVSQRVEVLFCTSRLLEMMPEYIDLSLLAGVKAVLHAGTTMPPDSQKVLTEQIFPGAPVFGMYGTSTTGICYQKPIEPEDDCHVVYVPSRPHVLLDVMRGADEPDPGALVPYGQEGQVRVWRLTEDALLPGFAERDRAIRVEPYGAVADRYPWAWLGDPYSPEFTVGGQVEGVY